MALTITLAEMVLAVRQETNYVNSAFVDDANEIVPWINRGIRRVWKLLTDGDPDRGLVTSVFTTTTNTVEYALPEDFYKIRGLDRNLGGNRFADVLPYQFAERNLLGGGPCRYRVIRNGIDGADARISMLPDPGSNVYRLQYVQAPPLLEDDDAVFDGIMGYERYPICFAARKVRVKAEESFAAEAAEMAEIEADLLEEAAQRDVSGNERIARVRQARRGRR